MRLEGKVAIVTGGAHGIGRAYCLGLAAEGAKVVIADIDEEGANKTAHEIRAQGKEAMAIKVDISSLKDTEEMAKKTVKRFGTIDILVNNAALFGRPAMTRAPFDEIPLEEWDRMMAINITGTFYCHRAVAPTMKAQKSGKIINISSSTFFIGTANRVHYTTTRGAIIGMTRAMAQELGAWNINVNCVAPGSTVTEDPTMPDFDKMMEFRKAAIPPRAIKRLEYPEDLVGTVIFLASKDSDFVTGQTIVVDGGHFKH
jgi:3-oxoacyl-[acyl-carrier protein] reductase